MFTRDVSQHSQTSYTQHPMMRTPSPTFVATPLRGMREPGTDYVTYLVSPGGNQNYMALGIGG